MSILPVLVVRLQPTASDASILFSMMKWTGEQQNAENLPKVKNGKSIQLIDDATRLSAEDRLIFRGIEDALRRAGIQIVERDQITADNVLVLTGGKDRAFREFISDLNKSGHLRNRLVVLLSCGDGNDASFLSPDAECGKWASAAFSTFATKSIH